jgi:mRNA interferase MazF
LETALHQLCLVRACAENARNGLGKDSGADAFQVKSLSIVRFDYKVGVLLTDQMDDIAAAIALCVGY